MRTVTFALRSNPCSTCQGSWCRLGPVVGVGVSRPPLGRSDGSVIRASSGLPQKGPSHRGPFKSHFFSRTSYRPARFDDGCWRISIGDFGLSGNDQQLDKDKYL